MTYGSFEKPFPPQGWKGFKLKEIAGYFYLTVSKVIKDEINKEEQNS